MSIFGAIMDKIFHHASAAPSAASTDPATSPAQPKTPGPAPVAGLASAPAQSSAAPAAPIDVGAVLATMASAKGGGGNYKTSIVDLLKLLDLDSSLEARKSLAGELGVHVGADGSAEENIALQHAVMQKLAENGGKVPDSMKG